MPCLHLFYNVMLVHFVFIHQYRVLSVNIIRVNKCFVSFV